MATDGQPDPNSRRTGIVRRGQVSRRQESRQLRDLVAVGIVIPVLPFYALHFGASPKVVTLLSTTFSLGQFLMSPGGGMPSSAVNLPDEPPSSATVTTAVRLLV